MKPRNGELETEMSMIQDANDMQIGEMKSGDYLIHVFVQ
jgi:hypothetical protein